MLKTKSSCALFCLCTMAFCHLHSAEPTLQIRILSEEDQLNIGKPFKVEFANRSDQPLTILHPCSADGFRSLSLAFIHKQTQQQITARPMENLNAYAIYFHRRRPVNLRYPEQREMNLGSRNKPVTIEANDVFHFYFYPNEMDSPDQLDYRTLDQWNVQLLYEPKSAPESSVWKATVRSQLFEGQLTCSLLENAEKAMRVSEPIAIELLEKDPKWITRSEKLLELAIANDRPLVLRWLIQHGVDPFLFDGKPTRLYYGPLGKIESLETLKVLWDECPNRRKELFKLICDCARLELALPYDLGQQQYADQLRQMIAWGAKSNLVSAIYLGDLETVKALLSNHEVLPEAPSYSMDVINTSPFAWAVACGHVEIAEWLLDHFKLDINSDYHNMGPLLAYAVWNPAMTELLCKRGVHFVDDHPPGGYAGAFTWQVDATAYDYAAAYGVPEAIEIMDKYSGVDSRFGRPERMVVIAAEERNWKVVHWVATHPGFVGLKPSERRSVLANVREKAVEAGFGIDAADGDLRRKTLTAIELPLEQLGDIEQSVANIAQSPAAHHLMAISIELSRMDVVRKLLDVGYGESLDYIDFMRAIFAGNQAILELFADRCEPAFAANKDDLLTYASNAGDFVTAKWLLKKGAKMAQKPVEPNEKRRRIMESYKPSTITSAEVERLISVYEK